ncbi:MAG: N-6 DNA methylase [Planctomycetaceae bacterium]
MSNARERIEQIQRVLMRGAEFDESLLERDYKFAHRKRIPLAGFAYRPLDARSACIGVVTNDAFSRDVADYRELGAPLLLVESDDAFNLWRVGSENSGDKKIAESMSVDGIRQYFAERPDALRPHRIYEAKTSARIERPAKQLELFSAFVDPELLPAVEQQIAKRLTTTVVSCINDVVSKFGPNEWVIKTVFRLLAGKILRDKQVPNFRSLTLSHVSDVLRRVEQHYGSRDPLTLSPKQLSSLDGVVDEIQSLGDLRNLTTESLGDVYEQALITKEIRKIHGTHKTPSYLVDYVVWQLAKWIEEIPVDELRFFEPGCGHAPFLVSLMRLLRTLDIKTPNLSEFFRERFVGVDNDPFALEIARLSLTLADEPNPDGWHGLAEADMYASDLLEKMAAQSTVLLTNPPYEGRKAEELLYRVLPQLPVGAIFGAVVPATLLFSDKPRAIKLRKWITSSCQLAEVDLFPERIFTFANHECAVLIGRIIDKGKLSTMALQTRIRRVRNDVEARSVFRLDYRFDSTRYISQGTFSEDRNSSLWIAEFQSEIWNFLGQFERLSSIAHVNQGLQHKGTTLPKNAQIISEERFIGSKLGFFTSSGKWDVHNHPQKKYLNISADVIRRKGSGTDCMPQILVNYAPIGQRPWRLKPFVDPVGRPFTSRFLSVRPIGSTDLVFLWALLLSPLANLFANTHLLKRDVTKGIIETFPIPPADEISRNRVCSIASQYIDLASRNARSLINPGGYGESELLRLLTSLDAEVLRLYQLPAKSERFVLEQFRGAQRPGVPIRFTEYYPPSTPDVPLYAYLSKSYQRWLRGGSPELSDADLAAYDTLVGKVESGKLTKREANRLHNLQTEVDGRDYAVMNQIPNQTIESGSDDFDQRLRELSDRTASAVIKRSRNENSARG